MLTRNVTLSVGFIFQPKGERRRRILFQTKNRRDGL